MDTSGQISGFKDLFVLRCLQELEWIFFSASELMLDAIPWQHTLAGDCFSMLRWALDSLYSSLVPELLLIFCRGSLERGDYLALGDKLAKR